MNRLTLLISVCFLLTGCWAVAAGAGAETAYVATQEDRTAGETIEDQRITASVKSQLLADPEVGGLDIDVDTHKANVTLQGFVRNKAEADEAVRLARSVHGVNSVRSELVIE